MAAEDSTRVDPAARPAAPPAVQDGAAAPSPGPGTDSSTSSFPLSPRRGPPPALAERYQDLVPIGEGGMGVVYRAHDPRLGRTVAIKLIKGGGPALAARFLQEARAQARVVHDNVCRVYEAGEADGEPFVAMQLIEGEPLSKVNARLTLEQRVKLLREVASAVHEAHRLGLIHRDLKPQNIMVEVQADGACKPYVVDFGLARDVAKEGETVTGAVLGTPAYMPPEQALGRVRAMDRRSDVYSLGATLYRMLAGRPPFVRESDYELLVAVANEEPEPLRRVDPSIPADLETITMKCLAKEPERRYPSARALAEDLQRWLDGEPIAGRREGPGRRLLRRARKHKALVATVSLAALSVLVLGGVALRARWRASEEAALAQKLGQDAEAMRQFLRYAYALPLHDPAPEKALILERMREIEALMSRLGPDAVGPGHHALGRGYLGLHRYDEAKKHLDQAWNSGYRTPELQYALGLVLGELYRKARADAQQLPEPEAQQARLREAEATYLAPAREHVEQSRAARAEVESPLYAEGLIAFYAKRYDEARDKARKAREAAPWLAEPAVLEGDVARAVGDEERARGEQDAALRDYDRADEAYRQASEMARSDASVHERRAGLLRDRLEAEILGGRAPDATFAQADAVSAAAIAADPAAAEPYVTRSRIYFWWAWHENETGKDPRPSLDVALAAAEQAAQRQPLDAITLDAIGNIHFTRASYESRKGMDPRPSLAQSRESLQKAIAIDRRSTWSWNDLGLSYQSEAEYDIERGLDPSRALAEAVRAFDAAIALDTKYANAPSNECFVLTEAAEFDVSRGLSPDAALDKAVPLCEEVVRSHPDLTPPRNILGLAHLTRASHALDRGADPGPDLDRAAAILVRMVEEKRADLDTYALLGKLHLLRARGLFAQRGDPAGEIAAGRAVAQKMIEIAPQDPQAFQLQGQLGTLAGRAAARAGADARPSLAEARAALEKAVSLGLSSADLRVDIAALHGSSAALALGGEDGAAPHPRGAPAPAVTLDIERGLAAAKEALSIHPGMPAALAEQGKLQVLLARAGRGSAEGRDAARQGLASLDEAVRGNKLLDRTLGAFRQEASRLAEAP
jgi:serine/threonine-protein kinase